MLIIKYSHIFWLVAYKRIGHEQKALTEVRYIDKTLDSFLISWNTFDLDGIFLFLDFDKKRLIRLNTN